MDFSRQASRSSVLFIALAGFWSATPGALHGQQPSPSPVGDEQLTLVATAYVEIAGARDEVQAQLANSRNKTLEAQKELRDGLKLRIVKIIQEKGLTVEEYVRVTYVISVDAERREAFEQIVAELTKKETDAGASVLRLTQRREAPEVLRGNAKIRGAALTDSSL